jgi:F0F1-type ATP synthase membrane subunit c/vacuolar-type H+-ATPase subunit K
MDKSDKIILAFAGVFYSIFFGFMIPTAVEITSETQHNQESMRDFLLVACGVSEGIEFAITDFANTEEVVEFYNSIFDRCMNDTEEVFGEEVQNAERTTDEKHVRDHELMIICAMAETLKIIVSDPIPEGFNSVEHVLEQCLE